MTAATTPRPAQTVPPDTIRCVSPATGAVLGDVPAMSAEGVRRAVVRARTAQARWGPTPIAARKRVLRLLRDAILDQADALCDAIVEDAGKTRENAMLGEIWPILEKIRWTLSQGPKHLADERVSPGLLMHKAARITYRPLGVVGVIAPWNYPLQNILGPVIPALFAGNAVIVKVSEQVAWSAQRFQQLLDDVLDQARYPKELVQLVCGGPEAGRALIEAGVDKIVFTGSVANGRAVAVAAAEQLTPVILELGGKDPLIVCEDADMDRAVHAALAGVYINAGQNCLASERILVMEGAWDRFVPAVTEAARALRQGTPPTSAADGTGVDVAAIVSPHQTARIDALVQAAVADGADLLVGGRIVREGQGNYYAPTVLAGVTPDMAIMQEEVFGPVMLLCRVRDDEEAIRVANSTAFGLGCTVVSGDLARADRLAARITSGSASINDFGMTYMANDLPFGGVGASGHGRLNGRDGLRAFTNPRAVLTDRFGFGGRPAALYPVHDADYALARATIRAVYSGGLRAKAQAGVTLLNALRTRFGRS